MDQKNSTGISILASQCLMQMVTTGILLQCIGIFVLPVSEGLGVSAGTFMLHITVMFIVATLVLTRANTIYSKLGARKAMLLTGIINGLGIIGFSLSGNIVVFCICGGILGISEALGLFYLTPVILNTWYGNKAGLYIGIAFAFSGIGGIVFNQLGGAVMAAGGWRRAYLVLGIIALAVGVIAALLVKDREADAVKTEDIPEDKTTSVVLSGVPYSKAIKSFAFLMVAVFTLFFEFSTGINPLLPGFAQVAGGDPSYSVTAATIGTVGAATAGFIIGVINGKSAKVGVLVAAGSGMLSMLLLLFGSGSMLAVYAAAFLLVFSITAVTPMLPAITSATFGAKDFDSIYAKVSALAAIPPIIASATWGYILSYTSYSFVWGSGLIVFATVLIAGLVAIMTGGRLCKSADK